MWAHPQPSAAPAATIILYFMAQTRHLMGGPFLFRLISSRFLALPVFDSHHDTRTPAPVRGRSAKSQRKSLHEIPDVSGASIVDRACLKWNEIKIRIWWLAPRAIGTPGIHVRGNFDASTPSRIPPLLYVLSIFLSSTFTLPPSLRAPSRLVRKYVSLQGFSSFGFLSYSCIHVNTQTHTQTDPYRYSKPSDFRYGRSEAIDPWEPRRQGVYGLKNQSTAELQPYGLSGKLFNIYMYYLYIQIYVYALVSRPIWA